MTDALIHPTGTHPRERLAALGADGRYAAYEDGGLTQVEFHLWAALYPEEVPLINGELPCIVATLADLE